MADMGKRFRKISIAIKELIVDMDALGLSTSGPFTLQANVERQAWRFMTDAKKVDAYKKWLQQQINANVLTVQGGISGKPWTATYIEPAYQKGHIRAYTDLRAADLAKSPDFYAGSRAEFIRSAFDQPMALNKMELLSTRAFSELKGVTDAMSQQMSRILATGLAQGIGPIAIARQLQKNVSTMTRTRARTIARTEIIYAHAEGQLDAYVRLGVKEVGIMAEWSTAGDDIVCPLCGELEGVVMTVKEARGLIPRHPNCRCTYIPAIKARKMKGQKRGKQAKKAMKESIRAEGPKRKKRTFKDIKKRSTWAGKELI